MSAKRSPDYYAADTTDTDSDSEYSTYTSGKRTPSNYTYESGAQKRNRQPKSFSKNALMARENRLKKKKYVENLEKELARVSARNRKLTAQLERQSKLVESTNTELKYMKAVLANSRDISRLLRSINTNTGMCVGTSLDRNLTMKSNPPVTDEISTHPWVDATLENDRLLSDVDDFDLTAYLNEDLVPNQPAMSPTNSLDDHTYTLSNGCSTSESDDVGVCLHISNHRVALEFCGTCNENAQQIWNNDEEESSYKGIALPRSGRA